MAEPIELTLPVPPSDNRYYGKPKRSPVHKYLTRSAKVFRHEVAVIVNENGYRGRFGRARVAVKIILHLPSGGDIQNRMKGLFDALEHAEIFDNDRQVDDFRVIRGHPVKGGRCHVTIWRKNHANEV